MIVPLLFAILAAAVAHYLKAPGWAAWGLGVITAYLVALASHVYTVGRLLLILVQKGGNDG